jgi:hypothetical protein
MKIYVLIVSQNKKNGVERKGVATSGGYSPEDVLPLHESVVERKGVAACRGPLS